MVALPSLPAYGVNTTVQLPELRVQLEVEKEPRFVEAKLTEPVGSTCDPAPTLETVAVQSNNEPTGTELALHVRDVLEARALVCRLKPGAVDSRWLWSEVYIPHISSLV